MADRLRTPFFIAALVLIIVTVLIEVGMVAAGKVGDNKVNFEAVVDAATRQSLDDMSPTERAKLDALASGGGTPGIALKYLAFLDGVLLFTVGLMGMALLVKEKVQARTQGCITLLFSLLLLFGAIVAILLALAELILMISLLLAVPFGTLTYLALYGAFAKSTAAAILALLMLLKLGAGICLIIAQQRFIQNKGLVLLFLSSLLGNVIIGFLHGIVPGILVSITDNIGAIVIAIIAVIWAIFLFVGSIGSVLKALKPS